MRCDNCGTELKTIRVRRIGETNVFDEVLVEVSSDEVHTRESCQEEQLLRAQVVFRATRSFIDQLFDGQLNSHQAACLAGLDGLLREAMEEKP